MKKKFIIGLLILSSVSTFGCGTTNLDTVSEIEGILEESSHEEETQDSYPNGFVKLDISSHFVENNIYEILDVRENYTKSERASGSNGRTYSISSSYTSLSFIVKDEAGERLNYRAIIDDNQYVSNENFIKLLKLVPGDKVIYKNGILELYK